MRRSPLAAFSLLELTIVMIIIGLLTGAIFTGQSLIKAAEIRAQISQIQSIDQAVNTFRDKYSGLPGDLMDAANYWPSRANNGNGNGLIETTNCTPTLSFPDCSTFNGERAQFFLQLSLAGLTQNYDGSATLVTGYPEIKLHSGSGMFVSGPWETSTGLNTNTHLYATDPVYLAMIVCNPSQFNVSSGFNDCGIFTAIEANDIDTKIDDGNPNGGKLLGASYNTNCITGNNYSVATQGPVCNLLYSLH